MRHLYRIIFFFFIRKIIVTGSLMGSQRGLASRGHGAGSQQQLLQGGSGSSRHTSLMRQLQESRMRDMQAMAAGSPIGSIK